LSLMISKSPVMTCPAKQKLDEAQSQVSGIFRSETILFTDD